MECTLSARVFPYYNITLAAPPLIDLTTWLIIGGIAFVIIAEIILILTKHFTYSQKIQGWNRKWLISRILIGLGLVALFIHWVVKI